MKVTLQKITGPTKTLRIVLVSHAGILKKLCSTLLSFSSMPDGPEHVLSVDSSPLNDIRCRDCVVRVLAKRGRKVKVGRGVFETLSATTLLSCGSVQDTQRVESPTQSTHPNQALPVCCVYGYGSRAVMINMNVGKRFEYGLILRTCTQ